MYFIRTDHIGWPVLATDALGAVASSISHKPFGEVHTSTGLDTGLRFPGQVYHWESELHQNWMRDYDPTTGRYVQGDPLGLVDGASVYGYVGQNPVLFYDRNGEAKKKYKVPENPNKKKGADERKKSGERERNKAHPDGEEHSRRPKGGFRPPSLRTPLPFMYIPPDALCPPHWSWEQDLKA
jgi:RHS repeat-associated protein